MRRVLPLLTAFAFASSIASAGVPDPARSNLVVTGEGAPCQFRFRADGALDQLTVNLTVRDFTDTPIGNCTTDVHLKAVPATAALCICSPMVQGARTNADGAVQFVFQRVGGRGTLWAHAPRSRATRRPGVQKLCAQEGWSGQRDSNPPEAISVTAIPYMRGTSSRRRSAPRPPSDPAQDGPRGSGAPAIVIVDPWPSSPPRWTPPRLDRADSRPELGPSPSHGTVDPRHTNA
jgi:hypothetical protein